MAETTVPATEAVVATAHDLSASEIAQADDERASYELAFHVLPTVAEGEVAGVFEDIKARITKNGAELFDEEAPERIDLAYEIVKQIEGKNRSFHSAYFGWVRFRLAGEALAQVANDIDGRSDILRSLIIKLTKVEESHPFKYHEAVKDEKKVTVYEEREVITEAKHEVEDPSEVVSEKELKESLEKITGTEGTEPEEQK